jgi:hypothetical protein
MDGGHLDAQRKTFDPVNYAAAARTPQRRSPFAR